MSAGDLPCTSTAFFDDPLASTGLLGDAAILPEAACKFASRPRSLTEIADGMSHPAPWTVLSSSTTFSDPWLTVRSDQVRTADGDTFGTFHVTEYPDWVTIVGLTEGFRLVLVREYRHGVRVVPLGLPGGLVDEADGPPGERAAAAAARRELLEETGHGGGTLEPLLTVHPNPSNQTNTAYCFLATGLSGIARPLQRPCEGSEHGRSRPHLGVVAAAGGRPDAPRHPCRCALVGRSADRGRPQRPVRPADRPAPPPTFGTRAAMSRRRPPRRGKRRRLKVTAGVWTPLDDRPPNSP